MPVDSADGVARDKVIDGVILSFINGWVGVAAGGRISGIVVEILLITAGLPII